MPTALLDQARWSDLRTARGTGCRRFCAASGPEIECQGEGVHLKSFLYRAYARRLASDADFAGPEGVRPWHSKAWRLHLWETMRFLSSLLLVLSALPAFAQADIFPDKATKRAVRQLEPGTVSAENRSFLKGKMKSHNKDMRDLTIAVATLRMNEVERFAQGLANEPRLDRSMGTASKLPDRFFDVQDQLKKTAQALADAGKADNVTLVVDTFHELMAQCVACHASFKDPAR